MLEQGIECASSVVVSGGRDIRDNGSVIREEQLGLRRSYPWQGVPRRGTAGVPVQHVIFVASRMGVREPIGGGLKPNTAGFAVLRVSPERVVRGREELRAWV